MRNALRVQLSLVLVALLVYLVAQRREAGLKGGPISLAQLAAILCVSLACALIGRYRFGTLWAVLLGGLAGGVIGNMKAGPYAVVVGLLVGGIVALVPLRMLERPRIQA